VSSCVIMETDVLWCWCVVLVLQIMAGLLYMKAYGLAHRDLSLENVMITCEGCRIIDLGMCLYVPEAVTTSPVLVKGQRRRGKPGYVAPEVIMKEGQPVDAFAADVWSLGVMIYGMMTFRQLYTTPSDASFRVLTMGKSRALMDRFEENFGESSPQT
jgi:serine/threonine protein kinase